MARPTKSGLEYFSTDVDMFNDPKLELLAAEFGLAAEALFARLLCAIYRNGYFLNWGEKDSLLLSRRIGGELTAARIDEIVAGMLRCNLFSATLFDEFGILTSKGIQERYLQGCQKRESVSVSKTHVLVSETFLNDFGHSKVVGGDIVIYPFARHGKTPKPVSETKTGVMETKTMVSETKTGVMEDLSTQSKGKERKVNSPSHAHTHVREAKAEESEPEAEPKNVHTGAAPQIGYSSTAGEFLSERFTANSPEALVALMKSFWEHFPANWEGIEESADAKKIPRTRLPAIVLDWARHRMSKELTNEFKLAAMSADCARWVDRQADFEKKPNAPPQNGTLRPATNGRAQMNEPSTGWDRPAKF